MPTGYVAGRPGLLDAGIGTIALVDASGTTTVEMDLLGITGIGVPVGATVTVKYTVTGAGHEVTTGTLVWNEALEAGLVVPSIGTLVTLLYTTGVLV